MVEATAYRRRDALGHDRIDVIAHDITEREEIGKALAVARDRAVEAAKLKSDFLANMSHEIRTPMNAVIGMTDLLLETELTTEQQECADTIRMGGEALVAVINDILDFSKAEAGKLELEQRPFQLRKCIEDALDLLAPRAAEKRLDLAYLVNDAVPITLVGDDTRVRQILVNLLGNAVKFTETGDVVVTADAQALSDGRHECHITVRDTGIGMAESQMARLFQAFSQGDTSTTRRHGGTGLGLAISKRLAELMGGRMWVESVEGHGSSFHLTIVAPAAASALQMIHVGDQQKLLGKRLLVVDDNATNRLVLTRQTSAWGMVPSAATGATEALHVLREGQRFDVAILDMEMPEIDGVTLAGAMREVPGCEHLPLILATSLGTRSHELTATLFAATLTKPLKAARLREVLVSALTGGAPVIPRREHGGKVDRRVAERHPLRVLLAEDNLVNQKVATRTLERLGYAPTVVSNGIEVLSTLEIRKFDVVLMDVQMPEMDGLEATGEICRRWPPGARPHIIAMTANAMAEDRARCLAAGMDDYIAKPVQIPALQAALARCRVRGAGTDDEPPAVKGPLKEAVIARLRSLQGDDEDDDAMATELLGLFTTETARELTAIREAISQRNPTALRRSAHRVKGSSANLGMAEMSDLAARLEECAGAHVAPDAMGLVAQLEAELAHVRQTFGT